MSRCLELEELVNRKIIARDKALPADAARLTCELSVHYQQLQRFGVRVETRIRSRDTGDNK
jgi:hypothetical protein